MKLFRVITMAAVLGAAICAAPQITWAHGVSVGVSLAIPAPVVAYPAPVYYQPAYYPPPAVYGPAVVIGPRYGYGYHRPYYRHWGHGYGYRHHYGRHR